tara:strand:+ start:27200 stop:28417 length:1218 start_codon:yes stop_codon:yes gene_type:complete
MARATGNTVVDARQERDLKKALGSVWVRFSGSLEDQYIHHSIRRARKLIGRSLYVLIALFLVVTVPVLVLVDDPGLAGWRWFGFWPLVGALVLLFLAVKVDALTRWMSTLVGLALMVALAGTLLGAIRLADTFLGQVAAFETVYVLIIGFSILRLPPTRTLFWCLGSLVLALTLALVLGWSVQPASLLLFYGFPLVVCALNGYMLDASARHSYANNLLLAKESDRLRQWRDNADREARRQRLLNEFMAHIAGNPRVSVLLDQALAFMIEHTPAVAGAAWRLADDGLHQEASRGLDAVARGRRHLPREGLLAGALDSEGDVTVRHDVPAGYLDLETGHSRMRPGQVLFVTVRQGDDEPLGILELAALTPFDDDARALLESLAPSLAYALVAAMGREDYMRRHRQAG